MLLEYFNLLPLCISAPLHFYGSGQASCFRGAIEKKDQRHEFYNEGTVGTVVH